MIICVCLSIPSDEHQLALFLMFVTKTAPGWFGVDDNDDGESSFAFNRLAFNWVWSSESAVNAQRGSGRVLLVLTSLSLFLAFHVSFTSRLLSSTRIRTRNHALQHTNTLFLLRSSESWRPWCPLHPPTSLRLDPAIKIKKIMKRRIGT